MFFCFNLFLPPVNSLSLTPLWWGPLCFLSCWYCTSSLALTNTCAQDSALLWHHQVTWFISGVIGVVEYMNTFIWPIYSGLCSLFTQMESVKSAVSYCSSIEFSFARVIQKSRSHTSFWTNQLEADWVQSNPLVLISQQTDCYSLDTSQT